MDNASPICEESSYCCIASLSPLLHIYIYMKLTIFVCVGGDWQCFLSLSVPQTKRQGTISCCSSFCAGNFLASETRWQLKRVVLNWVIDWAMSTSKIDEYWMLMCGVCVWLISRSNAFHVFHAFIRQRMLGNCGVFWILLKWACRICFDLPIFSNQNQTACGC